LFVTNALTTLPGCVQCLLLWSYTRYAPCGPTGSISLPRIVRHLHSRFIPVSWLHDLASDARTPACFVRFTHHMTPLRKCIEFYMHRWRDRRRVAGLSIRPHQTLSALVHQDFRFFASRTRVHPERRSGEL